MRHPAQTSPAQTLAALGAYHEAKSAHIAWQHEEHNRLQTAADKNPKHAEWVHEQQQRLLVLTAFRDIADHVLGLLYAQATGHAPEGSSELQATAYASRSLSVPVVLHWLEYDATETEINEVASYLNESRTKLRLVAHLSATELQDLLSNGHRRTSTQDSPGGAAHRGAIRSQPGTAAPAGPQSEAGPA